MAKLFNRVFAYHKSKNVRLLSQPERFEVGKLVWAAYQLTGNKKRLVKVESKEPEGTFKVLNYPSDFKPVMDAIISKFYSENPDVPRIPIEEPGKKVRKRIPAKKKPAYSITH